MGEKPKPLNAKRAALLVALCDPPEGWEWVTEAPCLTIRWGRDLPTPGWAKEYGTWPDPTYHQMVFLALPTTRSKPVMRTCRAPWVACQDTTPTLTRALEVLADPAGYLDREMRQ